MTTTLATRPEADEKPVIITPGNPPPSEIVVVDLFSGAGGFSTGAQRAIEEMGGTINLRAINHWPVAIDTHQKNHPRAQHYVEDVERADPEAIVPDGYLDILIASPECRFYSRARGGKPTHDQGRMNPWVVLKWLTSLNVRTMLIENVPEFTDWGPLLPGGKPDKKRKGLYFEEWVKSIWGLGYQAEWRMLNAADHGDTTSRTRFFLIARNDGKPIRWPEATHSREGGMGLAGAIKKWRGAREIIDWDNTGRSLLDDPKYLKKPLSIKTRRRIAKGLEKYGGSYAPLYIRLLDLPDYQDLELLQRVTGPFDKSAFIVNRHGENGSSRCHRVGDPVPTVTASGAGYLVQPEIGEPEAENAETQEKEDKRQARPFTCANRNGNAPRNEDEPLAGITTTSPGGGVFLVEPDILVPEDTAEETDAAPANQMAGINGQKSGAAPGASDGPLPPNSQDGAICLVGPVILLYYSQSDCSNPDKPLPGMTATARKHALVNSVIVPYYSRGTCSDPDKPLPSVTTKDRHALCKPTLTDIRDPDKTSKEDAEGQDPQATVAGNKGRQSPGIARATLVQIDHGAEYGDDERRARDPEEPLPTIIGKNNLGLARPMIIQRGDAGGNGSQRRDTHQPLPAITTSNEVYLMDCCLAPQDGATGRWPERQAGPLEVANFGEGDGQDWPTHEAPPPTAITRYAADSLVMPETTILELEKILTTGVDPRRIVIINDKPHILDIKFRMLHNKELARAMGFDDEEGEYEFTGTVSQVTRQIGNAVPVNMAAALVRAILSG